jgi:hypothetical protein
MAIFKLKRVNATKWDLKQEQMKPFEDIRSYVIALGRYHILRDAVIVNLILDHGAEKAEQFATAFCGRSFLSLNKLQDLIDGTEPFEYKRSNNTNRETIQHNRSNDRAALGEVVSHTRAALPGTVGIDEFLSKHEPKHPKPVHTPKDFYTAARAIEWMTANGKDPENWQDYFYQKGVDQSTGTPLYKLNPNIRQ